MSQKKPSTKKAQYSKTARENAKKKKAELRNAEKNILQQIRRDYQATKEAIALAQRVQERWIPETTLRLGAEYNIY